MENISIDKENIGQDINELRKVKNAVDDAIKAYEQKQAERRKELVSGGKLI